MIDKQRADELLQGYDQGSYSLSETCWRLLELARNADDVQLLLAYVPAQVGAALNAWAHHASRHTQADYIHMGADSLTASDMATLETLRMWAARGTSGYDV
jgi:hypothetical protein